MGTTHRPYSEEFKKEAVRFVLDGNRTIAEVARNIGVHELTLGKWVKKEREERTSKPAADGPLDDSERMELIRLRAVAQEQEATIAELRMQVDFAKKVATWFAKDPQ
jgi:transposase